MTDVQTVDHTSKISKETKEVIDLLDKVYGKIKAKAQLSEYQELLSDLYIAVEGADKMGAEAKSKHRAATLGYLVEKLGNRLL